MTRTAWTGLVLAGLVLARPVAGQGGWAPPTPPCEVKPGHFLVNSALLYLQHAYKTRYEDQRQKDLKDANKVLTQAVTTGGQAKNGAAWYYFGRYYVAMKDLEGADSTFTLAESILPACRDDIAFWRRWLWVPAFNAGVAAMNAGNSDSAIASFRRANQIYAAEPQGLTVLATLYANLGQSDSAAVYFGRAVAAPAPDTGAVGTRCRATRNASVAACDSVARRTMVQYVRDRNQAMFNLAATLHRGQRYPEAAVAYRQYLAVEPSDAQALAGLANVFQQLGQKDSAQALYDWMIAHAEAVEPLALFQAGVEIYNGAPPLPDTAAMGSACRTQKKGTRTTLTPAQRRQINVACDSVTIGAVKEHDRAAADQYRVAAKAFDAGLTRMPGYRDALFNLANVYFVLEDADRMLAASQQLAAVDPMNRTSLRLVAQAWQMKGKSDSALHYVTIADSLLPVEVAVSGFLPDEEGARLSGLVTNFHDRGSAPQSVTFEFLDATGNAVANSVVEVPALEAGANHAFEVQVSGKGVAIWRYRKT